MIFFRFQKSACRSFFKGKGNIVRPVFFLVLCFGFLTGCLSNPYKSLSRFKLKASSGRVTELVHKQSGARLVLVKNKDPARSFTAAFRTPPYDNTGLFHIFEHAVLAGSRLYPSKSNFLRVSKSSPAAFINALTTPDFTFYPFVTRSEKDFENLLSVYMDAVFFPKAIEDPRIVQREGRRYEIDPETGGISLNGVVFNEMKGIYSNPHRIFYYLLTSAFLPGTPYSYVSGGRPTAIAGLKFRQIQEAHKTYYHPQNALIFLYGDINFRKALSLIDKQFLSLFEKDENFKPPEIPRQGDLPYSVGAVFKESVKQPLDLQDPGTKKARDRQAPEHHPPKLLDHIPNDSDAVFKAYYPGPKGPDKDWFAEGYVLGSLNLPETIAFHIMMEAFASHASAPLKLSVLKKGLAQSVFFKILPGRDNAVAFVFQGTGKSKIKALRDILQRELEIIRKNGFDEKLLRAVANKYEFQEREKKHNAGLKGYLMGRQVAVYWIDWREDIPLSEYMDIDKNFEKVKALLADENFVKVFFEKHFENNSNRVTARMLPDPEYSKKFNQKLKQQAEKALESKALSERKKEDKLFREWVSAEEPEDITDKTPVLSLSDIKTDEAPIPSRRYKNGSYEVIEYPRDTSGISYIRLFFDLQGVKQDDIKLLHFFVSLLKKTDTKNYSFQDLSRQIDTVAGAFDFDVTAPQSGKNPKKFKALLKVSLSFLNENRQKSAGLLKEVLLYSQFLPQSRTQELLNELKTKMSHQIINQAPYFIFWSAYKSFFPLHGGFLDEFQGGLFYEYALKSDWDAKKLVPRFQTLLSDIFNQGRLRLVTLTAEKPELKKLIPLVEELKSALALEGSKDQNWSFAGQKSYKAYAVPGEVQYLAETSSFEEEGLAYSGALRVYGNYLNTYFMNPRLREKAGAYGAWNNFYRNGLWQLSSYRDPHLGKSFEVFSKAVDFMKKEDITPEKLRPIVIGALKPFYEDRSTAGQADFMTSLYLRDLNWDDHIKTKREILAVTPESFKEIHQALSSSLKKSQKAVAGHVEKIKKEAPFAKEVLSLP